MVKILNAPNTVLSASTKPYSFNDGTLLKLLREMTQALEAASDPKGVGLAAPQIGKSVAVFIAQPSEKGKVQVFVNPKILEREKLAPKNKRRKKSEKKLEGCLSLQNIWGEVQRDSAVTLSYSDEKGKKHTKKFKGFMATIVQHEVDHLEGVLFPKHVLEQKGQLYQSHKDKKGKDVFEPIEI